MASCDDVINLQSQKHLIEQLAYEEIRHYLVQHFVLDPVLFMQTHKKRPEDLNGAYLRKFYRQALKQGIQVRQTVPEHFRKKFLAGLFFTNETCFENAANLQ